ncbi:hypothetical protein ACFYWD_20675 [Streptomyces sp. NPDC003781]|uniref:hypothetical protein n=1 Tax=Streptomyces sp. NPDC003781 TaxID=3364686 RepID=UPI0036BE3AB6
MEAFTFEPYDVVLQGGPFDGQVIERVSGDPMTPPDAVHCQCGPEGATAIYSPRPAEGDGPLWVYVFIGYRPTA